MRVCKQCNDSLPAEAFYARQVRCKMCIRENALLRTYNLTVFEYEAMAEAQNYCCAICGGYETGKNKKLHVDHDHETKEVRSLLCTRCNTALGLVKEDPEIALSLLNYIQRHKQITP
jgi:hypothetical protein